MAKAEEVVEETEEIVEEKVEEKAEEMIKEHTGMDLDLTPSTPEVEKK